MHIFNRELLGERGYAQSSNFKVCHFKLSQGPELSCLWCWCRTSNPEPQRIKYPQRSFLVLPPLQRCRASAAMLNHTDRVSVLQLSETMFLCSMPQTGLYLLLKLIRFRYGSGQFETNGLRWKKTMYRDICYFLRNREIYKNFSGNSICSKWSFRSQKKWAFDGEISLNGPGCRCTHSAGLPALVLP